MPKTTKDETKKSLKTDKTNVKDITPKVKNVTKKATTKKDSVTKKKSTSSTTKKTQEISTLTTTSKKSKTTSTNVKKTSRASTKKASSTNKKNSSSKKITSLNFSEYYDLPYRYNQTIIKVLAQTPQMLFVYWDISDEDRLLYTAKYGEDFFSKTTPVLVIHNETKNYTFEVEINDFANSWYLPIKDADCRYVLELGRRKKKYQNTIKEDYIYVTSSNKMQTPNDHILFETFSPNITYQNIKTGELTTKDFSRNSKYRNMQKIYNIYNLYKEIYKNELFDELISGNHKNPSSLSSSQFH